MRLIGLVGRFEGRAFSTRDVLMLIVAGLRGGGGDRAGGRGDGAGKAAHA